MTETAIEVYASAAAQPWKLPYTARELALVIHAMCQFAGKAGAGLSLALMSEAEMAELNLSHLGCPGPTNVLSFEENIPPLDQKNSNFLGNMALGPETVLREAFLYGQEAPRHTIRLIAHGLAHLMGYDHGPRMDAISIGMERAALDFLELKYSVPSPGK